MSRLRAGLIGLGAMGRHHARVLRALDRVELVAGADPLGDVHGILDGLPVVAEVSELLRHRLDYAVVACSTAQHEAAGLLLAQARVPALIEKPLAPTVTAAARLVDAFESGGLVASVGYVERYNPALRNMRARLQNGEVGEVFQIATRRQGPFPNRTSDVGVVKDLATHDLDFTSWITGADYQSVTARTARRKGSPNEDLVSVLGLLDTGIIASHLVNWMSPVKERVSIVTGERGCLIANNLAASLVFHPNGFAATEWDTTALGGLAQGDILRYAIPKWEPLVTEHEAFRDCIEGRPRPVIITLREGLNSLAVAEAVLEAAATGTTVATQVDGGAR